MEYENEIYAETHPEFEMLAGDNHLLEFKIVKGLAEVPMDPDEDGGSYNINLSIVSPEGESTKIELSKAATPIEGHFLGNWQAPNDPFQYYLVELTGVFDGVDETVYRSNVLLLPFSHD